MFQHSKPFEANRGDPGLNAAIKYLSENFEARKDIIQPIMDDLNSHYNGFFIIDIYRLVMDRISKFDPPNDSMKVFLQNLNAPCDCCLYDKVIAMVSSLWGFDENINFHITENQQASFIVTSLIHQDLLTTENLIDRLVTANISQKVIDDWSSPL
ncbi:hypothetical protein GEMRC1_001442 [Eukaryota sp. GEM-RC1]